MLAGAAATTQYVFRRSIEQYLTCSFETLRVQYTITAATHIKYAIKMHIGLCLQPNSMSKTRAVAQPVKTAGFIKMQAYLHLSDVCDVLLLHNFCIFVSVCHHSGF